MENQNTLSFVEFIKKFYPQYEIDDENSEVINSISLWVKKDPEFEKSGEYFLEKGILLMGTVGTGKSNMFIILQNYMERYLKSPYAFRREVVWAFTSEFNKRGYESLNNQNTGNCYYDELCMIDLRTNFPNKEEASYYGGKLFIGEELIMMRSDSFKFHGFQTHFTTNATREELMNIYGERAYSRLTEMCNFFTLVGKDRRGGKPYIVTDRNQPAKKVEMSEWDKRRIEQENKSVIEQAYANYLNDVSTDEKVLSVLYMSMRAYGVVIIEDADMEVIVADVTQKYVPSMLGYKASASEQKQAKQTAVWEQSKRRAVIQYFEKLKNAGAKSIFGMVSVDVEQVSKALSKEMNVKTKEKEESSK